MSGYIIDPTIWEDELAELSDGERCVSLYLLCGGGRKRIPGLVPMGTLSLAEALRRPESEVKAHVQKLFALGRLQYDERYHLFRLPEAPKNPLVACYNPNMLVRWWNEWCEFPKSPLKYLHLQMLTYAANLEQQSRDGRFRMLEKWQTTFGPALERHIKQLKGTGGIEQYGRLAELGIVKYNSNGAGRLDRLIAGQVSGTEEDTNTGSRTNGCDNRSGNRLSAQNDTAMGNSGQETGENANARSGSSRSRGKPRKASRSGQKATGGKGAEGGRTKAVARKSVPPDQRWPAPPKPPKAGGSNG